MPSRKERWLTLNFSFPIFKQVLHYDLINMIATKNLLILLTSLAALGAASATSVSAQWHEHESPTGVAQHGHHDGDAPKTQHHGDWSPAWNPDDDENTKKPSETNVNYRSNHEESHHDLHWHQTRGEDGLAELRRLTGHKWSSTTKAKHPRDNDHGHEEYEGRFGGATHTAEDDSPEPMDAHVEEYHQDGKFHHARGATLGFYECANHNWVAPCKYTLVEDGKCYNR